ncbi:MAG: DUF4388 domain-containing protein, partial [Thermodesulfobacteriota bacterium]
IIIVDINIPVIDAEKVYRILRNNPNTKDVSFIFIATELVDLKDFRTDADSLILRPIKLEELHGIIRKQILRLKRIKGPLGDKEKEIEGKLSHFSLPDLLQMLQLNSKEGVVKVTLNDQEGMIYVKEGEIYNATLGASEKEKALFRLLTWKEGSFEFLPGVVTKPRTIFDTTSNLLMEGMRQYDEFKKIAHKLPAGNSQIKLKVDTASLPKGLKAGIREILSLVEYYPKVADLVDHCTLNDFEAYQILLKLLNKGLVDEIKTGKKLKMTPLIELLSSPRAIRIREKILNRWSDMASVNFGKVLIASTGGALISAFLGNCKELPSFTINRHLLTRKVYKENPFGVLGRLKLYGGMDILLYALPTSSGMGPIWDAFSKSSIGLILLWNEEGIGHLERLAAMRGSLLSNRRVPVMYVFINKEPLDKEKEAQSRELLDIKRDEQIFTIDTREPDKVHHLFFTYFGQLMKEEYVSA